MSTNQKFTRSANPRIVELQNAITNMENTIQERIDAATARFTKGLGEVKDLLTGLRDELSEARNSDRTVSAESLDKLDALAAALDDLTPDPAVAAPVEPTPEPVAEIPAEVLAAIPAPEAPAEPQA
jgi:hypothetical protein